MSTHATTRRPAIPPLSSSDLLSAIEGAFHRRSKALEAEADKTEEVSQKRALLTAALSLNNCARAIEDLRQADNTERSRGETKDL